MNLLAFGWWIIFDLCFIFFFAWAMLKIPNRKLRFAFLYLLAAGGIYFNALFAKWLSPLGDSNPLILTRVIFTSGILIHSAFGFFVVAFGGNSAWSKHPIFRSMQATLFAAAPLAMGTQLIIADVTILETYPKFQATHGILYLPLIAFLAAAGLASIGLFYLSWRRCRIPFQKFQIGATLAASGLIFVCMTITNGLIPAITHKSYLSVLGGIFPMLFFATVLYLLANGEAMSLRREFAHLLGQGSSMHEDNQAALREVIQGLRSLLHKGAEQISRRINFRVKPGTVIQVTLEHTTGQGHEAHGNSVVARSLASSMQHLYSENQRMLFSLIRAESLLQEKWLTKEIEHSGTSAARLQALPRISEEELDANLAEFRNFWGHDIVCASPNAFVLLQKIEKRKPLTHPLVMTGEPATGKALLCRALHHVRGGKPIAEFSARLESAGTIFSAIATIAGNPARRGSGILLRHADALDPENLKTLWAFIDKHAEHIFFYLTGSGNFVAQVRNESLLARLRTLALESIPLRNRPEDTERLCLYLARRFCQKSNRPVPRISPETMEKLKRHSWPGNITELREIIEHSISAAKSTQIGDIPLTALLAPASEALTPLEAGERTLISQYLARNNYNKNRTRIELGITVNTLNAKIQKYGILAPANIE